MPKVKVMVKNNQTEVRVPVGIPVSYTHLRAHET